MKRNKKSFLFNTIAYKLELENENQQINLKPNYSQIKVKVVCTDWDMKILHKLQMKATATLKLSRMYKLRQEYIIQLWDLKYDTYLFVTVPLLISSEILKFNF